MGNNSSTVPTSGDVHLYADPKTFDSERPLLYADCEGLRGGTLEPVGAKWRRRMQSHKRNRTRTASFDRHVRRRYDTTELPVLWATTPEKSTREYFVENLYPRLLYTFSDVIVFVVKNARMIEGVIEQLIIWADAVIESASNQPVLPHAIIVLNAFDNKDAHLWDVDNSTEALLNDISQAVSKNPKLRSFASKWNDRGFNISSIQSLLLAYYSSIRVVRIPEKSQPPLIENQIQTLYSEIERSVTESHSTKHEKRLKLNAESLQPYLRRAFDHFCRDLKDPFNFIKASFADTDVPSDFCGNTLKLAVDIMTHWSNRIDGALLFKELSFLVASCVMLDVVRNGKLGQVDAIFREYIDHFDETLDEFCEKVWPCEFVTAKGLAKGRCVNVRAGHTKGHQLERGQVIAGDYQSQFSPDTYRHKYRSDIFAHLRELLLKLTASNHEQEFAARLHQETILEPFYKHIGGAENFVSHSTCLSCLVAPAEHWLPCKHVLCTACVKDFGHRRGQNTVEMRFCPLHKSSTTSLNYTIFLKPESGGTRILSMDGGGVRGIIMLLVLTQIEEDLGGIPVQMFFDLIIGTSTGGIIALGLVEKGWRVASCYQKFKELAAAAFQKHKLMGPEFLEWFVTGYQQGRYKTEPLEQMLISQYGEDNLFGGEKQDLLANYSRRCKVAVTATSTNGTPFVFANYNRVEKNETTRYVFLRAEKPEQEIKIWEASRVTSAAPRIFKPYLHAASGHTFLDGGVYHNNPIEIALAEQNLIWPQNRSRLPDVLLSLGTGYSGKKKTPKMPAVPATKNAFGIVSYYKQLLKIAVDHVKSSQRSEEEYRRVRQHYGHSQQANMCFKRFNFCFPEIFGSLKPDRVEYMEYLEVFAETELCERQDEVRYIANRLIATTFLFDVEPSSLQRGNGGSISLQGHIRCRFEQNSRELMYFGELLKSRIREAENSPGRRHGPCFVIEDRSRPQDAVQVPIKDIVLDSMEQHGIFSLDKIRVAATNTVSLYVTSSIVFTVSTSTE